MPVVKHFGGRYMVGVQIGKQCTAHLVVIVSQRSRVNGVQPCQRLLGLPACAVFPGLVGRHAQVAGCRAVFHPSCECWCQGTQGCAMAKGIEHTGQQTLVPQVVAVILKHNLECVCHVWCGQRAKQRGVPDLVA